MRLARVLVDGDPVAVAYDAGAWREVDDLFAAPLRFGDRSWPEDAVSLLAPVAPTLLIGFIGNANDDALERAPRATFKSVRSVIGPGDSIRPRIDDGALIAEGELAVVIGREARALRPEQVPDVVLGYTIVNDFTNVDAINEQEMLIPAKNGDGYAPLGPWIETDLDPADQRIVVELDGVAVADSTTALLKRSVSDLLVYLTASLTLGPGDVVMTGAPRTIVSAERGQVVTVRIDGIGALVNPIGGQSAEG